MINFEKFLEKYPQKSFGKVHIERLYEIDENCYAIFNEYLEVSLHPCGHCNGNHIYKDFGWQIYLYHECGPWIIGKIKDAEKIAEDLQKAIKYCKDNP